MEIHLEFGGDLTNINELQRECRYIYTYIYIHIHTHIYIYYIIYMEYEWGMKLMVLKTMDINQLNGDVFMRFSH